MPIQLVVREDSWSQAITNRKADADQLLKQGIQQAYNNQYKLAVTSFKQALELYRITKNRQGEKDTLIGLGNAYVELGNRSEAISIFQQSLIISQQIGDRQGEGNSLNGLGEAYRYMQDYDKASDFDQKALAIFRQIKNQQGEGDSLKNLGFLYLNLGEDTKAIDSFQKAIAIYQQIGDYKGAGISLEKLGVIYWSDREQYDKAIEFFQQALVCRQKIGDRKGEADILTSLGQVSTNLNQTEKAIDFYQQALSVSHEISYQSGEMDALMYLGNLYRKLRQYEKVIPIVQQELDLALKFANLIIQSETTSELARAYEDVGQYEKAIEIYRQALIIDRKLQGDGEKVTLVNLGRVSEKLGQSNQAIEFYQQLLALGRTRHDRETEGSALDHLGYVYDRLGQYDKAIDLYQQSLLIAREIQLPIGEIASLNKLGAAYDNMGQYEKAINFYQQGLDIARKIEQLYSENPAPNNPFVQMDKQSIIHSEAASLNNLGIVYAYLGQYEKAIEFYQQSLKILDKSQDHVFQGLVLDNLGTSYRILGKYEKAISFQQRSLEIARSMKNYQNEAGTLINLGVTYSSLGQYQTSIELHQQSLDIFRKINDRRGEGTALINLGNNYRELGDFTKALDFYQQSLVITNQIGDREGQGKVFRNLGYLLAQQNKPELAILFYKQSINLTEAIRKDILGLSKEEQKSYLDTVASTYRNLADLLLKQGRVSEALQILDLLKIQELEDYLKNIKGSDRTTQNIRLLEPERNISDKLSTISNEQITEFNQQLASQIQQIPKSDINKTPEYLQKLPQGAVLIYPLILSDRLELIVFSANSLPINRTVTISKTELEKLVTDFRNDLQDISSLDVKDSSQNLYNLIIKPIEEDLKRAEANTILYAPDGLLRYIPLAALYDGKQWLVEKYRVDNLIAYSLFDPNHNSQTNFRIFVGAFGGKGSETRFGLGGLPSTIPEVDNITTGFPNTTKLIEYDFTANATKTNVVGKNIVHLATHAEFKSGSPLDSYILFGDGSKLTLSEVKDWQLKDANLVLLSACQTGIGSLGNGSEILGFGYQVQRAGAKASIASLWKVSDGGTQVLMKSFYENLKKRNITISTSLREAQLAMIHRSVKQGEANYNHPYFWSAFVLIGNGI
ncbi:tetratricopeptide repeat protein [Pseudanabaena sp. 'Roaring Creek']|uniref:CHAT domain-containing protein n=1 Tax=Pseudanabaena sp. 'Roaring Creek' TaxID=1681830 RepID=UPI0018D1713A|nr:tetratricopeptide repeat protein [Pseudanabaena sp. 'Roaring Creek']